MQMNGDFARMRTYVKESYKIGFIDIEARL
jgi:hypothetical protein